MAVDVDGVAHGLEGVEADADRQRQAQQGQGEPRKGVDVGSEEVPVFEEKEDGQVADHRRGHRAPGQAVPAPPALHQAAVGVVHGDGEEHDNDIDRLSPAVEKEAQQHQAQVPQFQGDGFIDGQRHRQVEKEKRQAGKNHRQSPFRMLKRENRGREAAAFQIAQAKRALKASAAWDCSLLAQMRATTLP